MDNDPLSITFAALADPTRRAILAKLADGEATVNELAAFLFREDEFPAGVVLSTGTSLVPDLPFTLKAGDEIRISISEIGELVNHVVRGKAALRA